MKQFLQQKLLYIGLIVLMLIIVLLSYANLGSSVAPTPQNLPVAFVMEDKGVQIPGKGEINFGKTLQDKILNAPNPNGGESPLKWTVYSSQQEAQDALDHEKAYAALILPANLSERLLSLQGKTPQPADVQLLVNQGMNYMGATLVGTALDKMVTAVNGQLREQMLGDLQKRGDVLNTAQAKALATPFVLTTTFVHATGTHSANGNAPAVMTQVVWFGSLISAIILILSANKVQGEGRRFGVVLGQLLGGVVFVSVAVSLALLMTHGVLGLEVPDLGKTWLYMAFIGVCFFLIQSAVVNWLGMKGAPIFILIFFFGAPILALPVEIMPEFTQNWLYSWLPLRFSAEVLRDVLYFGQDVNLSTPAWTLGTSAIVGAVLILLSGLRKNSSVQVEAIENQAV